MSGVGLLPVDADNRRAVAGLAVTEEQRHWVAEPAYYLALCHYSPVGWRPLAVATGDGTVVGYRGWGGSEQKLAPSGLATCSASPVV